jgi:hypothetical protein
MAYQAAPARKVYRLTQRLRGYDQHQDFPATEAGLGKALQAWSKNRNRVTGQAHGAIKLVETTDSKGQS